VNYTNRVSEEMYPLTTQYADGRGFGTHYSEWVSLQDYHRAWLFVCLGDISIGTMNVGLQQAQDATGTGVKAITGKTITQLNAADGSDLVCIELQTEELDVDNGFEHVRFYVTLGTVGVSAIYSATLFGICSRFKPIPTTNWTEIVD